MTTGGGSWRRVTASAPGRVNLIGDHTDYTGGLVLPMVVDLHTVVHGEPNVGDTFTLASMDEAFPAAFPVDIGDPSIVDPPWGRYVAGVVVELRAMGFDVPGFAGGVSTTLPIGAGLSSSAALEVAVARAILESTDQTPPTDVALALALQRAEQRASGVPCGIMDQLSIIAGRQGFATLIDCHTLAVDLVEIPGDIEFVVRHVMSRTLVGSEYAERVDQCRRAEDLIGPLRLADASSVNSIADEVLRRRARHVVDENKRVRDFRDALAANDFDAAGRFMTESHRSLAVDYETSNPVMDAAVDAILREPGVTGARMTGGGFGGCLVALRRR